MAQPKSIWIAGLTGLMAALIATLVVRFLGLLLIDVPPEFPPLAGIGPTVFFTSISSIGAAAVYALVRRASARPSAVFRAIALVVLLLSFLPDLWLLSDGAAQVFPGATPGAVGILMVMHVAAAIAIVGALTRGEPA